MIANIVAQLLGVLVVNWMYVTAIQFVVLFRQTIRYIILQSTQTAYNLICSFFVSTFMLITFMLGIASILSKVGGISFMEFNYNHIYPLIAMICMEFAEFLMFLFIFRIEMNNQLKKVVLLQVDYEISVFKKVVSIFKKPNLAYLQ